MAKTSGGQAAAEQKESARESDTTRPGKTERVSGIEKVGGKHGTRFSIPNHPEHCDVTKGPGGKMDR
jgi:hypothetical protein